MTSSCVRIACYIRNLVHKDGVQIQQAAEVRASRLVKTAGISARVICAGIKLLYLINLVNIIELLTIDELT